MRCAHHLRPCNVAAWQSPFTCPLHPLLLFLQLWDDVKTGGEDLLLAHPHVLQFYEAFGCMGHRVCMVGEDGMGGAAGASVRAGYQVA